MAKDIKLKIALEPYEQVEGRLHNLINKLQSENILDLKINFSKLKNQVNNVQNQLRNNPLKVDIETNDKNIKNNLKTFSELKKEVNKIYGGLGEVSLLSNGNQQIERFVVKLKKADGIVQKIKYNLNKDTNSFNIVDTKTIDKTAQMYEKALRQKQQLEKNMKNDNEKEFLQVQENIYKELNSLQKEEFSIKQKIISANEFENSILTNRLNLIKQQQNQNGKILNNNGMKDIVKNNSLLLERKKLTDDLMISQNKYNEKLKEGKKNIENTSKHFKTSMNNKIKNLNNRYKDFIPRQQLEEFQQKLNNLNNTNLKDLKNEIKSLKNEFNKINNITRTNAMTKGNRLLTEIKSSVVHMVSLAKINLSFETVANQLKNCVKAIYDLDTEMIDLKKVTDETRESYSQFQQQAHQMALEVGKQSSEVIRATSEWVKAGESFRDAQTLAKTTLIGSNVGDVNVDEIHKFLIAPLKAFDMKAKESMHILDIMNHVANKHAITVRDLGQAYSLASSVMALAGNDINQTTALITAAQAKTQLGGNVIGTGFKAMALRLTEIKQKKDETFPKLKKDLKDVGVELEQENGKIRSTYDVLKDLHKVWDSLSQQKQLSLLDKMGGKEHANILAAAITNFDEAEKVLQDSLNSQGSAMAEQEKYMESMAYKIDVFKEKLNGLYQTIINSDFLKSIINDSSHAISILDGLNKKFGSLTVILGSAGLAMFAFNKKFREFLIGTKDEKGGFTIFNKMKLFPSKMEKWKNSIDKYNKQLENMSVASKTAGVSTTQLQFKITGLKLKTIAAKAATYALQAALTVGLSVGISLAIKGISKLINYYKDLRNANEEVIKTYKENSQSNRENIQYVKSIAKEYDNLINKTHLTKQETEKLSEIKQRLAETFPEIVTGMNQETGEMEIQKKTSKELLKILKEKQQIENAKLISNGGKALKGLQHDLKGKEKQINKLKSKLDEINTGIGSQTKTNTYTGQGNINNINDLKKKHDELVEKQKQGINVTKQLTDVDMRLAKAYADRKIVLGQLNALENEKKASIQEFKPYIQSIINQAEGLTGLQKKLIENQVNLKPEDIMKIEKGDYSGLIAQVNEIIDKVKKDAEMNKIEILMKLKKPNDKDIKNYFNSIMNLSTKYKVKPIDLMEMFPLKINKNHLAKIVREYERELQVQMLKLQGKEKQAMGEQLQGVKNLRLEIDVNGKEKLDETANSLKNVEKSAEELKSEFNDVISTMDFYKQLMKEIHDTHGLTQQSIQKIITEHAELIPYINNTTKMYEILQNKLVDLEGTAQDTYQNMIFQDEHFSQEVYKNTNWLSDMKNKYYDADLKNYETVAQNKEKIEKAIIKQIAGVWADYYDKQGKLMKRQFALGQGMVKGNGKVYMSSRTIGDLKEARIMENKIQDEYSELAKGMRSIANNVNFSKLNVSKPKSSVSRPKSSVKKGKSAEQLQKERMNKLKQELDNRLKEYELAVAKIDRDMAIIQDNKELNTHNKQAIINYNKQLDDLTMQKFSKVKEQYNYIWQEINSGKYDKETLVDLNSKLVTLRTNLSKINLELKKTKQEIIDAEYTKRTHELIKEIEKIQYEIDKKDAQNTTDKEKLKYYDEMINKKQQQYNITKDYVYELQKQLQYSSTPHKSAIRESMDKYLKQSRELNLELLKLRQTRKNFVKELKIEADEIDKYALAIKKLNEAIEDLEISLNKISIKIDTQKLNNNLIEVYKLYDEYIQEINKKEIALRNKFLGLNKQKDLLRQEFLSKFKIDITKYKESDLEEIYNKMFPTQVVNSTEEKEIIEKRKEEYKKLTQSYITLNKEIIGSESEYLNLQKEVISKTKEQKDIVMNLLKSMQDEVNKLYEKQKQDRNKMYDDNLKATQDLINKKKKILNKEWSEDDYQRELDKKINEKQKLLDEINSKARDTSMNGKRIVEDLKKELEKLQQDIDDYQKNHNRKQIEENLDDILEEKTKNTEKLKEQLEKEFNNEKINMMSYEAILSGFLVGVDGKVVDLKSAMVDFFKTTNEGLSVMGNKLEKELIQNLKQANQLLNEHKDFMPKPQLNNKIDMLYNINSMPKLEPLNKSNQFKTNNINNSQQSSLIFNYDALIKNQGTILNENDLTKLIQNGTKEQINEIKRVFKKNGINI